MIKHWYPHPGPQTEVLKRMEFEILYGGARGGGKTAAGIVWLTDYINNPNYRALVIRKNADDLSDWIDRAGRMYSGLGAKIAYRPAVITFPSGAIIRTGHLKDDQAYTKYQGHEYQRMLIEELTQIPTERRYMELRASCRSTIPELRPQLFATTNPGGKGHGWVKRRFIDTASMQYYLYIDIDGKKKQGLISEPYKDKRGLTRIFVPAKVDDNPTLIKEDPGYVKQLDELKDTDIQLWKAWRKGSWDVFLGQVFTEWDREKHVVDRFPYNLDECHRIIGFDWGYAAPGCAIWLAVAPEDQFGITHVYAYREIYQNRKTPEDWARQLAIYTSFEDTDMIVLPHDCFNEEKGNKSIATIFEKYLKTDIVKGKTLSRGARINRVAVTHQFLSDAPDARPYLLFKDNCYNLNRTLPELVHDENNPEDVDTDGEDHPWDALSIGLVTIQERYKLSSGPVKRPTPLKEDEALVQDDKGNIESPDFWKAMKNPKRKSPEIELGDK